jgi:DNA-directed RNA polymerase subunit RPC12/RpoP
LIYRQSVLRGKNPAARWDYFECRACGPFEYGHHTGELRRTSKRMSWFCPACDTRIRHHGDAPSVDRTYQCHGCGSTLALNPVTNLMGAPPPRPDPAIAARRRRTSDQRMF